mmetsp:Transcript_14190/g.36774  ORF Transcript_14190/g.36774 Transcript_14190/m.36774 type:complete len:208 (+) Transcript_14190:165-788(+)
MTTTWQTRIYFSRMLHGRGVCRLAPPIPVAAALAGAGDCISQLVLESQEQLDRRRLITAIGLGAVLDGAALQHWFAVLHRRLAVRHGATVVRRLALHEFLFVPIAVPLFVAATAVCEAHARPWRKVSHEWLPAVGLHWLMVAPSLFANAQLVPKAFQVLVANSIALSWSVALSKLSHRPICDHVARSKLSHRSATGRSAIPKAWGDP